MTEVSVEADFRDVPANARAGSVHRLVLVLRVDVGTGGGEGTRVFVKFSHGF